jgi:hypothetical protein
MAICSKTFSSTAKSESGIGQWTAGFSTLPRMA